MGSGIELGDGGGPVQQHYSLCTVISSHSPGPGYPGELWFSMVFQGFPLVLLGFEPLPNLFSELAAVLLLCDMFLILEEN